MENKQTKSITNDVFMKFLIIMCYTSMVVSLIASIAIGITTHELISSFASMTILTMFTLLLIFFTVILFAYDTELKRKSKDTQLEDKDKRK